MNENLRSKYDILEIHQLLRNNLVWRGQRHLSDLVQIVVVLSCGFQPQGEVLRVEVVDQNIIGDRKREIADRVVLNVDSIQNCSVLPQLRPWCDDKVLFCAHCLYLTLGNKLGKRLEASKRDVVIIQTYRVKLVLAEVPNCDVCQEVSRYV